MLTPVPITEQNLSDFLDLQVRPDQVDLLSSNAVTIAQAHYKQNVWLRGLIAEGAAVGLIAMIDFGDNHAGRRPGDPPNAAYLWRFMIAAAFQGQGYGDQAMRLAFDQARTWGRTSLCLHAVDRPGSAAAFYRRYGLQPTGRVDADDEVFMAGPVRR
ncbi:MAG: GNAT family N-acetyltransferase [Pseudomonadota bacterium]